MFYVISHIYCGPNKNSRTLIDADTVEIWSEPAQTNLSKEVCIEGWCGTSNDWSLTAYGAFDTLEKARAYIDENWDIRELDSKSDSFIDYSFGEFVVAKFKVGQYAMMPDDEVADWAYQGLISDISIDTTDAQIAELAQEYEKDANTYGSSVIHCIKDVMIEYRQRLRDDQAERDAEQVED